MQFWKGNRLADEFSMEPADVAAQFAEWWRSQPAGYRDGTMLERSLRHWLTSTDGLGASWTDESDGTGFGAVWHLAYALVYRDPQTSAERELFRATARPTRRGRHG